MNPLEEKLQDARFWGDIGNFILLIGVFAETLIDLFWPDIESSLPLLRGRRATKPFIGWWAWWPYIKSHIRSARTDAVVAAGIIVFGGISLEWVKGNEADRYADDIRIDLQAQSTAVMYMMSSTRTP